MKKIIGVIAALVLSMSLLLAPQSASAAQPCVDKLTWNTIRPGYDLQTVEAITGNWTPNWLSPPSGHTWDSIGYTPCSPYNQYTELRIVFHRKQLNYRWRVDHKVGVWIHN